MELLAGTISFMRWTKTLLFGKWTKRSLRLVAKKKKSLFSLLVTFGFFHIPNMPFVLASYSHGDVVKPVTIASLWQTGLKQKKESPWKLPQIQGLITATVYVWIVSESNVFDVESWLVYKSKDTLSFACKHLQVLSLLCEHLNRDFWCCTCCVVLVLRSLL